MGGVFVVTGGSHKKCYTEQVKTKTNVQTEVLKIQIPLTNIIVRGTVTYRSWLPPSSSVVSGEPTPELMP